MADEGSKRARKKPAKSRRQAKPRARGTAPATQAAHKLSHVSDIETAPADGAFIPRPVHYRLLDAYESAFQDGVNPTDGVIAKKLQVRRETINRWRRRNAGLRRWLLEQIGVRAYELRPMVDRRVTQLAISGSPEHTKLFYQFVAKVGAPEDGANGEGQADMRPIMNFLVPCPDYPALPAATPALTTPATAIPTVAVSRG